MEEKMPTPEQDIQLSESVDEKINDAPAMEQKKGSKNKKLLFLILILGIILVGICGYLIYDKFIAGNDDIGNNENRDTIAELDVISDIVVDTFDITGLDSNIFYNVESPDYFAYYYRQNKLITEEFSDAIKIALIIRQYQKVLSESTQNEMGERTIFSEEVARYLYGRIFGKEAEYKYTVQNYIDITSKNGIWPDVIKNRDGIVVIGSGGIGGGYGLRPIIAKIFKAEKNQTKNEISIYQKVVFLDVKYEIGKLDIYTDYKFKNKVASDLKIDWDINYLDRVKKADIYKYTFKANSDGSYYFYSVEKATSQ